MTADRLLIFMCGDRLVQDRLIEHGCMNSVFFLESRGGAGKITGGGYKNLNFGILECIHSCNFRDFESSIYLIEVDF